jgi:diphthamide biosynthesis protein 3
MTWGPYWMFYRCPACGKKFRHELDGTADDRFGVCPNCGAKAELTGESKSTPADATDYETV